MKANIVCILRKNLERKMVFKIILLAPKNGYLKIGNIIFHSKTHLPLERLMAPLRKDSAWIARDVAPGKCSLVLIYRTSQSIMKMPWSVVLLRVFMCTHARITIVTTALIVLKFAAGAMQINVS